MCLKGKRVNDLLTWELMDIIKGCCYILNKQGEPTTYMNSKGDTLLVKVDKENDTMACFMVGNGPVCCYCHKM